VIDSVRVRLTWTLTIIDSEKKNRDAELQLCDHCNK